MLSREWWFGVGGYCGQVSVFLVFLWGVLVNDPDHAIAAKVIVGIYEEAAG